MTTKAHTLMFRRLARNVFITLVTAACVLWTVHLFDWPSIAHALMRLRVVEFLSFSLLITVAVFTLRGIRWLTVLEISFNRQRLWQSICANGVASGIASITPFQLGEALKLRMIPDHHGSAWRIGLSAFFVERALDLAGVCGTGLGGFSFHTGHPWLAGIALLAPLWSSQLLLVLGTLTHKLPTRIQPYTQLLHNRARVTAAALLTVALWLLYTALWWVAADAIHVRLQFDQASLLLGSVMLAVVASMTPGGLGVAELGSRGVLIWLGKSQAEADSAAIALRLLTLVVLILGGGCAAVLWKYRRSISPERLNKR
jgi:uncharacterized membrane protein YbhN (UPF0104 family)